MTPLLGSLSDADLNNIEFVVVGIAVLVVFVVASRFIAHTIASQLSRRNVRTDMPAAAAT